MKHKIILLLLLVSFTGGQKSFAQKKTAVLPLTSDSLISGNTKDVFQNFFQLALNRVISDKKEISFSSNPYAVMARMDTTLLRTSNYLRYTNLRRLNFAFSVKLDSSYRFNGFSSGIKYALINKRDETVSNAFAKYSVDQAVAFTSIMNSLAAYTSQFAGDLTRQNKLNAEVTEYRNGQRTFKNLDEGLKNAIRQTAAESDLDTTLLFNTKFSELTKNTYDRLRSTFRQRGLWTIAITDTTYKDQFFLSNLTLATEYVKGFGDSAKSGPVAMEFNSKAVYQFVDDTVKAGRDLHRQVLLIEPGLNFVFRTQKTHYSYAEFKISGAYNRIFSGLNYPTEEREVITINGTLRIRVYNDIWVPIEIKYDPKTGNVLGFLNIRANFSGIKSFAKIYPGNTSILTCGYVVL